MYPSSLPNIDLQLLPTFPAHVGVTGVLTLVKSGLSYTFGLNFQNVIEETNVSDMSKREVLVQDTDTGAFWRVKLTNLPTGQTDWGSIQNKPTEFPPSPIADGQVLGNVSGSTGVPVGVTLSALLDKISNTRGAVLYRGEFGWAALGAGAAGQVLTSGGAGADPSWQNAAAVAVDPWECLPIGVPIPVFDHIPGVSVPPTNKGYRYVNLTAGLTGSGGYNEGILANETVSGSAPHITATAVVNLPASPMHGQTIHLINTERRFIRAGWAGAVQDDAMQQHEHHANLNHSGGSTIVGLTYVSAGAHDASTGGVIGGRFADETRPRNIGATYFMRIL